MKGRGWFGKQRFSEQYQNAVGINAASFLHENSKELASILKDHGVLTKNVSIYEIGAAGGRNLKYIQDLQPTAKFGCNDLYKNQSFNNMADSIKEIIEFDEADTLDLVRDKNIKVDLLVCSDHLMHIQYDRAKEIIETISDKWCPTFIILREVKKEFEAPMHPRLFHNYDYFLEKYEVIHEQDSIQNNEYFIKLLKIK